MRIESIIHKPFSGVFDCFSDMQKFAKVHPVITRIEKLSDTKYRVHETLSLFYIPVPITYVVYVYPNVQTRKINMNSYVLGFSKIEMQFNLTDDQDYTHISEDVILSSSLPIGKLMESFLKKQHLKLFKNIERVA